MVLRAQLLSLLPSCQFIRDTLDEFDCVIELIDALNELRDMRFINFLIVSHDTAIAKFIHLEHVKDHVPFLHLISDEFLGECLAHCSLIMIIIGKIFPEESM